MVYPLISEYIESIMCAEENFASLTNLVPVLDEKGNPVMSSGNFAVVFKMVDNTTGTLYALKCFTKEQEGRENAYRLIENQLHSVRSQYLLNFRYYPNELFCEFF